VKQTGGSMRRSVNDERGRATRTAGLLLVVGVAVFVAGRLIDLAWHATHPEFETAADQVRAHAVVWLGALLVLAAALVVVVRGVPERGYVLVLIGAAGYAAVAVWHLIEHAQGRDPDLPHILLLVTNIAIFAGAAWVGLTAWRRRRVA
jgi:drug/metabolite transporter (DMT)-like permease